MTGCPVRLMMEIQGMLHGCGCTLRISSRISVKSEAQILIETRGEKAKEINQSLKEKFYRES